MFKKILSLLVSAMMVVSLTSCSSTTNNENTQAPSTETTTLKDGTYVGEGRGMQPMKVEVTVKDNKIETITVKEHAETPGISDKALATIPQEIIDLQGLGVDVISGATFSSIGVINSVANALEQAGADVTALRAIKKEVVKEEDKELTADVVVIGAGGAGLAAAITAHQNGSSVLVIEKMGKTGGNTTLAGGALNAVDDGSETALANDDSVELHYTQTYEGGDKLGDPELVHTLVDNAWDGVEWLKELGMEFLPGTFTVLGGLWPRAHKPVEPLGTGFFKAYENYIDNNDNIEINFNTKAEKLITEDGKVVGVEAVGPTGNKITYKANKGVVLATGGFSQNVEMRQEYNTLWPDLGTNLKSTNHPGATGDGIVMAKEVNADLVGMEYIQLLPMGDPQTGSLSGNIEQGVENRLYVNDEGNRFVDEGARRDVMTTALINQPNSHMWVVLDSHDYPTGEEVNNFNESINSLVAEGRAFKADTLEELAEQIGVDPTNFVNAIEEFNKACKGEIEDPFGRTLFDQPIDKAPYYAAARIPTVHHTMGGVKINTKAEVIDTEGNVIPGLYAAGEVTGGIHGSNRLGGNALTDTVVFGRIAGESASNNQ
ncbi:MAG: flavocytochrome c [Erysipelotrichaceae bacterium]|nr:flavocytochrome c [Erysipelotrichaceae bacterium]MDY5251416.1 flavocytochrome c [Erysipelotrichaceae bacterium]